MTLRGFGEKTVITAGIIIVLLVVFRLLPPSLTLDYVNKTIDELPEYEGHIRDIDLSLIRGVY